MSIKYKIIFFIKIIKKLFFNYFRIFSSFLSRKININKSIIIKIFNSFIKGIGKKIFDLIYLVIVFLLILLLYYFITGINYSTFTSSQIDEFIKKEIPTKNFTSKKYLVDMKGYGNNDLVILVNPLKDKTNSRDYNQYNFTSKIYIFSKIQKSPIQNFLFGADIYKKEYSFEFPFISIDDLEKMGREFSSDFADDYQLYKNNTYIIDLQFIDEEKSFINKKTLIIHGLIQHNWGTNSHFYGTLNYDFGGYNIKPLVDLYYDSYMGIGCEYEDDIIQNDKNEDFCFKGINNAKLDVIINDNLEKKDFTHIISFPSEVVFVDNKINIYLHNNNCEEGDYYGQPYQCGYSKYICYLSDNSYICKFDEYETKDKIESLEKYGE